MVVSNWTRLVTTTQCQNSFSHWLNSIYKQKKSFSGENSIKAWKLGDVSLQSLDHYIHIGDFISDHTFSHDNVWALAPLFYHWILSYCTSYESIMTKRCVQSPKIHENSWSNTKERDKHFIINEKVTCCTLTIAFFCRNWKEEHLELHIVQPKCHVN